MKKETSELKNCPDAPNDMKLPAQPPFGYRQSDAKVIASDVEAAVVRAVFRRAADGEA